MSPYIPSHAGNRTLPNAPCGFCFPPGLAYVRRMSPMAAPATDDRRMIDPFGRTVDYVRLSVTDRCNLRCTYCMAEEMQFLPKKDLLTLEELERLATALIGRG